MSMMNMLLGAGGFNPLSLSPALWLDASDSATLFQDTAGTTPATANNDPVGRWNDKSGNARNVTQGTSNARPLLKSAAQNNLNALDFDGINDFLNGGDILDLGTENLTAFVVCKFDTTANAAIIGKSRAANAQGRWSFLREASQLNSLLQDVTETNASASYTSTAWALLSMQVDRNGGSNVLRNSTTTLATVTTSATANQNTTNLFYVGVYQDASGTSPLSGYWFDGRIGEIIVIQRSVTADERNRAITYLRNKWAITP